MDRVPAELLIPPEAHGRGIDPHESALVLDAWLRRLAAQDTRCRAVLGRLARVFLRRSGQHELGFSRLGDYCRERLGLSARELQSAATVGERLEALPALRAAFDRGELSWSQTRLLAGVATAETEPMWLELARGRTVRAMTALIRETGRPAEEDDYREDEPRAQFRLRCPRRLLRLWRQVVELARRTAGAELSEADAAEAIAAEGLSTRPPGPESWPGMEPPRGAPPDPAETRDAFAELEWEPVADALPDDVSALTRGADDLDAFALDERMRAVVQAAHRIDWQMGRLLRVFLDRRLYRLMLFPTAARYLTERLGVSVRRARALVVIERKTWQAEALASAYQAGELSAVRALTILPVVSEDTAAAWVERARAVPVRRLSDEVEWALTVRDGLSPIAPPAPGASLEISERQMCARPEWEWPDAEIAFGGPVSIVALLRAAILAYAHHPRDSLWGGLEKLLLHVKTTWEAQPRHRDPVFARDGWRCAVPICTTRRNLHDHHLVFRSRGGDNGRENRITLCAWHHLRGIHSGRVRAWGEAPDGITWEIGVRAGRRPLLRLEGTRYASA